MERSLDEDAGALGRILESIPEFVIVIDREGLIRYVNKVAPGFDRARVMGAPAESVISPESLEVFRATRNAVLATGEPREYEVEVAAPDGSRAWYRSQMVPHRDGDELIGVVIMATNVTELKQARETVAQLQQLLPLCAWCGRIRTREGGWEAVEHYLERRMEAHVTHGLCQDCLERQLRGDDVPHKRSGDVA